MLNSLPRPVQVVVWSAALGLVVLVAARATTKVAGKVPV